MFFLAMLAHADFYRIPRAFKGLAKGFCYKIVRENNDVLVHGRKKMAMRKGWKNNVVVLFTESGDYATVLNQFKRAGKAGTFMYSVRLCYIPYLPMRYVCRN